MGQTLYAVELHTYFLWVNFAVLLAKMELFLQSVKGLSHSIDCDLSLLKEEWFDGKSDELRLIYEIRKGI